MCAVNRLDFPNAPAPSARFTHRTADAGETQVLEACASGAIGLGPVLAHVHSLETPHVLSHRAAAAVRARPIQIIGAANQHIDFVHIDDVVAANFAALHREPHFEIHHISADGPISLFELGLRIRAWCGDPVRSSGWRKARAAPEGRRDPRGVRWTCLDGPSARLPFC
jgi:nucleoside-diphosphate-sugar epimerase